ncbi:hypothetical protein NI456_12570 [Brevundimonas diminuta]|uniref:hypothetical protein n=1 Tax=Brevundimonas diminuta TaxID=293 RepID=UPI0020980B78|nr:hypothetical protein [Brevundimonas diminuta]MCO8019691.1 hypothetical protein [Brevundimonas diminuta]MCO8022773.1 hypothetical protein [Brevundimonas diminuta]
MTDEIRPVGAAGPMNDPVVEDRRETDRRRRERRRAGALVPTEAEGSEEAADPAASPAKPAVTPPPPPAAFAAQVLGQSGQKRGLKGGVPVLDAARTTYLGREYSGRHDRRPSPGRARKTEI